MLEIERGGYVKRGSEDIKFVRSKDNFLVFGSPAIEDSEIQEVVASMKSGWLGTGPKVARFEADFAEYKGVRYSAAVNSCTAALHLSMLAAGLKKGDEVITTPMTFAPRLMPSSIQGQHQSLPMLIWRQ